MKGWIKVHNSKGEERYFRASEIKAVYHKEEHTVVDVGITYFVAETVDEVLGLISKAEGKSLYEKLVDMHKECTYQFEKYGDCTSRCPYSSEVNKDSGLCVFGDILPSDWNPDLIPEEYR